jgi:hypothetical protein
MSSGFILKMNSGYNRGEKSALRSSLTEGGIVLVPPT